MPACCWLAGLLRALLLCFGGPRSRITCPDNMVVRGVEGVCLSKCFRCRPCVGAAWRCVLVLAAGPSASSSSYALGGVGCPCVVLLGSKTPRTINPNATNALPRDFRPRPAEIGHNSSPGCHARPCDACMKKTPNQAPKLPYMGERQRRASESERAHAFAVPTGTQAPKPGHAAHAPPSTAPAPTFGLGTGRSRPRSTL